METVSMVPATAIGSSAAKVSAAGPGLVCTQRADMR